MFELLRRQLPCLVALCGLLGVAPAWAATAVSATRIALPGVTLQNVQAEFGPGVQPNTLAVHVHADQAELPALGWHKINLELHGQLRRDAQLRWQFSGTTQLGGAPGGALSNAVLTLVIDQAANTLTVNLDQAATHLAGALPLDQPSHAQINLRHLPAAWLQGLLATVWSGHSVGGGTLDADLALDLRSRGIQSSGDVSATALSVAGNSSGLGTQNLTTRARFGLDTVSQPARLTLTGNARDGSVDIGPVQAHLPSHDVLFDLAAAIDSDGIQLDRVHVVDPDALALDGAFAFDAKGVVKLARADRFQAQFPAAYDRYGQPWLDGWLAPDLHPNGQLTGRFDYGGGGGWHSFALHTGGLDLSDDSGLLQANGLHGDLVWSSQGEQQPTVFAWNSLTFRQFVISAAQAHWRSRNGALSMQEPINVGFLKGQLHLTTLALRPAAAKAERIDLAASLSGVDLPSFDQAVGWNPLAGSVDATLTGLQIDGDHYQLGGQFTFKTLGGSAVIKRVWARHPFAAAPLFGADVSLHQLDLASLSDSYNFGSLSGRLDGTVDNLVLLNGSPDSFEFNLLAPDGGHISLRAANNLASLAGSGPAGGLQTAMMKVFKNANYKRIGLHGKLEHGVLQLGGLDGDHSGYTIVEGSGLPYMHVTGDQNRVDWSLFLKRLRATEQASADH